MITVICYGVPKVFRTREEAINFFTEGFLMSEGSERDRYADILFKLEDTDDSVIFDYDEEDKINAYRKF